MFVYFIATLALVVSSQLVIAQQPPLVQVQESWQNWKIEEAPERSNSEVESKNVDEPVGVDSVESIDEVDPYRPVVKPMVRYAFERAIIQPHYNQLQHDYQASFKPVQLQEPVRAQSQLFPVFPQVKPPQEYQPFKPVQQPIIREEPARKPQEQPKFPMFSTVQQAIEPPKKPQETISLYQQYMPAQKPEQQQYQPFMPVRQTEQQQFQPYQQPDQQQHFRPYMPAQQPEKPQYQPFQQPEQQQYQPYMPQEQNVQQYQPYGQQFQPYGQPSREEQPWMQQQPIRTGNQAPTWSQPEPQLNYQSWQQNANQQPGSNAEQQSPMYNAAPVQNTPQRPQRPQVQPFPQPNWPVELPNSPQLERPIHQQPQPYQQPQQQYQQPQPQPQYQQYAGEETHVMVPGVVDVRCPRNDDPNTPVHFPIRGNCQKFVKCYDGRAFEMDCPRGLDYNAQNNRCDYPEFARCSGY